ncbi:aminodeoxychorismate synthase component I [Neptunicella marina]|uniref:aminodeoxychorismate synthase n=1 Tax=Neptunicella marina TaxID=2125989 RepID=A0A8J6IRV3_9ALTE|nr:aminodeoxychorismate synthase component I [Neptunicella marina]MBC3764441.1 aminodeoxychorismate synthase component I [Neptunicella marina]
MSVNVEQLNISPQTDICQLFEHYSAKNWSMLLDSGTSQHQHARYDIMVAGPIMTLTTQGDTTHIWRAETNKITQSSDNPISLVRKHLEHCFGTPEIQTTLPFCGGALGMWGYDLGKRFETLPDVALNPYRTPDMAIGLYSWAVIKDHHQGEYYLVSHSDYSAPDSAEIENLLNSDVSSNVKAFKLTDNWRSNMTETDYLTKFNKVQDYLQAGDCYQVNLAQRFEAQYQGDEWQAYLTLRQQNQAPFSAFIKLPESSIISISPERFLEVKGTHVQTRPIKGTRPRASEPKQDCAMKNELQQSEKDRAENLMIVDLLRNDISKHCLPGSVKVPELFAIESFAAVHHLVSTVTGELETGHDALDLLQGAFPGGSITGAPKIRAMQIIDELEPHARNIYCGSIGYYSLNKRMDTSICIRTLLCENNHVYCWAGGGLVVDSDGELEYQETLDKVAKILPVLKEL